MEFSLAMIAMAVILDPQNTRSLIVGISVMIVVQYLWVLVVMIAMEYTYN